MTPRIACIHQGYELYGSDRSFAESVAALRQAYPAAEIEVVLPREGPILSLLNGTASRILIEPLWVLRRRNLPRLLATAPIALPLAVLRAARRLRRCDLVYINTSVIVDHTLAARFFPGRELIAYHAHDVPMAGLADASARSAVYASIEKSECAAFLAATVLPEGTKLRTVVEDGAIETTLPRYVRDHEIDLVVMGSHGRSGLMSLLLGSTAARLLDWLPFDTLLVPDPRATR